MTTPTILPQDSPRSVPMPGKHTYAAALQALRDLAFSKGAYICVTTHPLKRPRGGHGGRVSPAAIRYLKALGWIVPFGDRYTMSNMGRTLISAAKQTFIQPDKKVGQWEEWKALVDALPDTPRSGWEKKKVAAIREGAALRQVPVPYSL